MTEYRKVYAYHEKNDGMYELKSYWTSSETTQFESGENLEEYRTTTEGNINLKADRIEYDLDAGMLYLYSDETKIDEIPFRVSIKPKVNLGDIDDLQITQDNSAIKLSWDDPIDIEFSGLKIVEWAGTKVVRKEGSCPDSIEDGTLVIDSKTKNAYSSTPYSDRGLVNGVEYYYRFFPYDTEGNIIGDTCGEIIRVITLIPIEIPTVTGTYTYTGDTISPTFVNYDSNKMIRSGANSAKNAGTYTVTFTPKEDYMWVDTTVEAKEVTWTINPATISVVPSQSGTLTYNEQSQSPTWINYNSDQLTISGDTSGTNAGSYTATFTPKANYTWGDGSISKNATWSIEKASIQLTASMNSVSIYEEDSISITLGGCQYGYMTAGTEDPNVISTSINGSTLIINGINQGTTRVTIWESNVPAEVRANYSFKAVSIDINIEEIPQDIYPYYRPSASNNQTSQFSGVLYNNEIHIIGGYGGSGTDTSRSHFKWNGQSWQSVSTLPIDVKYRENAIVYNDEIHIFSSDSQKKHYKWNGSEWEFVSTTPKIFGNSATVVYNNAIYVIGGALDYIQSGSNYYGNNVYKWDGNSWTLAFRVPVLSYTYNNKNYYRIYRCSAVVYDNKIHILGGLVTTAAGDIRGKTHYTWNGTSVSKLSNNLLCECIDASAVVYNNKIHIFGGNGGDSATFDHITYSNNSWNKETDIPIYFYHGVALVKNDKVHLINGRPDINHEFYVWDGDQWIHS